jgi:hypothetical protein
MDLQQKRTELVKGRKVLVTSLVGEEIGELDSINWNTGKAVVWFGDNACPHFCDFNINQVEPLGPQGVV